WQDEGFRVRLGRYHGDQTAAMFVAWSTMWGAPWFRDWNIEAALPGITCPLFVIQGADDEYGTDAQVEAIVRGVSGPAESLIVPDCGHAPHIQARETVLERMARFVRAQCD
ncbi:MAG: alpha/beta hydrolase, partial [Rhodospirillaceae bacterium]|nr:alpha/beta hydrolase [Rhodospirillaceae bacterium]